MRDVRLVRVAVKDGGKPGCGGVEVQRLYIVEHIDVVAFEEENFGFGKAATGAVAIDVAADGCDGRDFFEGFEDRRIADVAEVKDALDTGKSREDFGAEKAVRVADDAELHLPKLKRSDQRLRDFSISG